MAQAARTTPFQAASAKVRARMPLLRRWSIPFKTREGTIRYLDVVWATGGRWRQLGESNDPSWQALPIGGFVIAFRLLL